MPSGKYQVLHWERKRGIWYMWQGILLGVNNPSNHIDYDPPIRNPPPLLLFASFKQSPPLLWCVPSILILPKLILGGVCQTSILHHWGLCISHYYCISVAILSQLLRSHCFQSYPLPIQIFIFLFIYYFPSQSIWCNTLSLRRSSIWNYASGSGGGRPKRTQRFPSETCTIY